MKSGTRRGATYAMFLIGSVMVNASAWDNGECLTPPMGWNSWNRFGCNVSEQLMMETADAMVSSGMRDAGYRYVVIDDCWQVSRDAQGNIVADAQRFPSGMDSLSRYMLSRGLVLGLYTDAGTMTCQRRPGSRDYEDLDMAQYAAWQVGYTKVDWCFSGGQDLTESYMRFREAIEKTGYPIVFSICSWSNFGGADTIGHLWRTTGDISASWGSVMEILDAQVGLEQYAGPGHWNDPDMLEVGNYLQPAENRAHFTLWCILAAPLMSGNDLRDMSPDVIEVLTNTEVIAVNQDSLGVQGTRVRDDGDLEIWVKPMRDSSCAVALLNRSGGQATMTLTWANLGFSPDRTVRVRDLWEHAEKGFHTGTYTASVESHGVVALRIFPNVLALSEDTLRLGDTNPLFADVSFTNTGQSIGPLTVEESAAWLTTSTSGSGAGQVIANTADPSGLPSGIHYATVTVAAQGFDLCTYVVALRIDGPPQVSGIVIQPNSRLVSPGESAQFDASAIDQFGEPISSQVSWNVTGGGSVDNGLFTSNGTEGTFGVVAFVPGDPSIADTADVRVSMGTPLPSGYLRELLCLETPPNSPYLPATHASGIQAIYAVPGSAIPSDGETFAVGGQSYTWRIRTDGDGMWADASSYEDFCAFWQVVIVNPGAEQSAQIACRHDDDLSVWLDGTLTTTFPGWDGGSERRSSTFTLPAGESSLLFKLTEGDGGNHFAVRLLDESGQELSGLRYRLDGGGAVAMNTRGPSARPVPLAARMTPEGIVVNVGAVGLYRLDLVEPSGRIVQTLPGKVPGFRLLQRSGTAPGVYLLRMSYASGIAVLRVSLH